MSIVKGMLLLGQFSEREVCRVPSTVLTSMPAIRMMLETHASREIGGREGRDWRIKQAPAGTLIPIYAASTDGTITLEIK
jgi:hypothetical protein